MKTEITEIKDFIRKNNTRSALDKLKELISNPFEKEVLLLESRFSAINKKRIIGTNKEEDLNQLQYDILSLLEEIERLEHLSKINLSKREKVNREIHKNDLQNEIIKNLRQSIEIIKPKNGNLTSDNVIQMEGLITIDLPTEQELWVLQKNNSFYYHTDRPIEVDYVQNKWEQENLNLGIKGKWELIICLVSQENQEMLRKKIDRGDWYGFKNLPKGIIKIKSVKINKE